MWINNVKNVEILKLLPHGLGVAYRGSSLVFRSITYLSYSTACLVVYAVFLACIDDICVLSLKIIICDRIIFQKLHLIFTGKFVLPQP